MTESATPTPLTEAEMRAIAKQYWDAWAKPGTWERMQDRLCRLPKNEADRLIKVIQREHWSRMEQRRSIAFAR